jgi:hypothetical protein
MRTSRIAALCSVLLLLTTMSCERLIKGTLEKLELWSSGSAYYSAYPMGDDYSGPTGSIYPDPNNSPNAYAKNYYYFHEDESPTSLGYKEGPHTDSKGTFFYHPDGSKTPGENGVWSAGPRTSGGMGGGGGASGVCAGGYKSPTNDAQLDAYCGAAYAYRCLDGKPLSDPGVQAVCTYYNDIKTSSAPSCPYCK